MEDLYGGKRIDHLIIHGTIFFFGNLLITFWHYYYTKSVFDFFNMVDIFQIFVISRSTEILIVLKFWRRVYTHKACIYT